MQVLATDDIDPEEARKRVAEQRVKLEGEIKRAEGKLGNERFVSKAPARGGRGRARRSSPATRPSSSGWGAS